MGASRHHVVRNRYPTAIAVYARGARGPITVRSVVRRRLAVAHPGAGRLDDLGEAHDGDDVVLVDLAAVDLLEEVDGLLDPAELRVVVLDVPRREVPDLLDLHLVDHGREDLLARAVAVADRDPDEMAALVLVRL